MAVYVPNTIANLKPGNHVCWFYETEEEHHAVITPFLRRGLEQGEKVVYIVHEHTPESILGYLHDDGFDPEPNMARGQLFFLTPDDTYIQGCAFDPDRMIALLHDETERALTDGYTALRVTGEMSWAQGRVAGAYRLPEYEAKLNQFIVLSPCIVMCQYHRRCFQLDLLTEMIAIHPLIIVDENAYDNFYYIPPAEYLTEVLPESKMHRLLQSLQDRELLQQSRSQAQRMEAMGHLAGGMAHYFNNLLTPIMGYTELVIDDLGPDHPLLGYLQQVRDAAERSAEHVRQLLSFSRYQAVEPRIVNLNELAGNTRGMLQRVVGEDIELALLLAPDLGMVKVDPGSMEHVLASMGVNARDAMPNGGKLTIQTANVTVDLDSGVQFTHMALGSYVRLSVSDTGIGMDEEVMAHIFEPFFTTKEVGKGSGLGLASCHGTVKQSGGHILVRSQPGYGTTFDIYLPLAEEATTSAAQRKKPGEPTRMAPVLLADADWQPNP